jgi:AcrR family transcriptional regulator
MDHPGGKAQRGRGRPRSQDARRAVLGAVLAVAAARGYRGLTLDAVAAASGVPKSTIYRHWSSKGELLATALLERAQELIPARESGDLGRDLARFLGETFAAGQVPGTVEILRGLAAEAQSDPAVAEVLRERLVAHRRAALGALLARGRAGHPRPSRARIELALDMVFGAFWYRLLITAKPLDRRFARELAQAALKVLVPACADK